jgi:ppGpp synthetase/RelA/SpoT-type nucleotidyltranferase
MPAERASLFLRLPVDPPRLKDDASLLQKAFLRGKGYADPYYDIEDKVGVRFVVLTSDEVQIIGDIVTSDVCQAYWFYSKDRDFEAERKAHPLAFGYQSDHYVLRSKFGVELDGVVVPPDTPCEVQIRTLLQHAYSELTHDTIYKPSVKTTPEMQRAAAKAMALIEATDDYFLQVGSLVEESVGQTRNLAVALQAHYLTSVGIEPITSVLSGEVMDFYYPLASNAAPSIVVTWLAERPYIGERIRERVTIDPLYSMTAVLLVYYVVGLFPNAVAADPGPLTERELEPIFTDLGLAMAK